MNESTPVGTPNPDDGADSSVLPEPKNESTQSEQSRPRNTGKILGEQECLAGLSQLPGLLTTGFMKPQTSNSIRGVYHELLQHHQRRGHDGAQPVLADEDIDTILGENPAMLKLIEPLLTDEQVKMVLQELKNGDQ
jgi:hypothetical protein